MHSLLHIPILGEFRELEGDRPKALQSAFEGVQFLITDKMSMVGRKMFGQGDKCLHQALPHSSHQVLAFLLETLVSSLRFLICRCIQLCPGVYILMQHSGHDQDQVRFKELRLQLSDGQLTQEDWQLLMRGSAANVADSNPFENTLCLHPLKQSVAEHNALKLCQLVSQLQQSKQFIVEQTRLKPSQTVHRDLNE